MTRRIWRGPLYVLTRHDEGVRRYTLGVRVGHRSFSLTFAASVHA